MKITQSQLANIGISAFWAILFGIGLPIFFGFLFSANTTATRRDIFPELDDPLESIGYFGFFLSSLPAILFCVLMFVLIPVIHQAGMTIPVYDSLSNGAQVDVIVLVGAMIQTFLWFLFIYALRKLRSSVLGENYQAEQQK